MDSGVPRLGQDGGALTGFGNQLSQCRAGAACTVRPGRYRVTVTLRAGGPARTVTRIFRVLPGPGLMVDP